MEGEGGTRETVEEARRKGEERGRRRVELMVEDVLDGVVEVENPGRRRPADSFCSGKIECGLALSIVGLQECGEFLGSPPSVQPSRADMS